MNNIIGIILIVLGVLALAYHGISYTETKQDAKIGPLTIQHEQTETIPVTPLIGGVILAAGVATLFLSNRGRI